MKISSAAVFSTTLSGWIQVDFFALILGW
jgi:hypothetical protein